MPEDICISSDIGEPLETLVVVLVVECRGNTDVLNHLNPVRHLSVAVTRVDSSVLTSFTIIGFRFT